MELEFHVCVVPNAHKIVVPRALAQHHKEVEEFVRQQHMNSVTVRRNVALFCLFHSKTLGVTLQAINEHETALDDQSFLTVGFGIMHCGESCGNLLGCVWIQAFSRGDQRRVEAMRFPTASQCNTCPSLGQLSAWTDAVHTTDYLSTKVRNDDKLLQQVLGRKCTCSPSPQYRPTKRRCDWWPKWLGCAIPSWR